MRSTVLAFLSAGVLLCIGGVAEAQCNNSICSQCQEQTRGRCAGYSTCIWMGRGQCDCDDFGTGDVCTQCIAYGNCVATVDRPPSDVKIRLARLKPLLIGSPPPYTANRQRSAER